MMTTGAVSTVRNYDPAFNNSPSNLSSSTDSNYTMQPVANPNDLLSKDSNSQWKSLNPTTQGNVAIPDLLQSGYHIGLDSIVQTRPTFGRH
jgi:hypothetical protein